LGVYDAISSNTNPDAIPLIEKYLRRIFWGKDRTPENTVNWRELSRNKNAIPLLKKYLGRICWDNLSLNQCDSAICLLEKHIDKVNWKNLSMNECAIPLLEKHFNNINWDALSKNKNAIHLLEKNPDKINWVNISYNSNLNVFCMMKKFPEKIQHLVYGCDSYVHFIKYSLLTDYIETIDCSHICDKESMIVSLKQHPQYINWNAYLCREYEMLLFNLDYVRMKADFRPIAKEIAEYVFNPMRMKRMSEQFGMEEMEYIDYF
jgi:ribosomal protein L24E